MDKILDLKGVNKYFCSICNGFHNRCYKDVVDIFGNKFKAKITNFFNHSNFAYELNDSELFKLRFNRSWKNYDKSNHIKMKGSRKQ